MGKQKYLPGITKKYRCPSVTCEKEFPNSQAVYQHHTFHCLQNPAAADNYKRLLKHKKAAKRKPRNKKGKQGITTNTSDDANGVNDVVEKQGVTLNVTEEEVGLTVTVEKAVRPEPYSVSEGLINDQHSHTESGDLDVVLGEDSLVEPDSIDTYTALDININNHVVETQNDESLAPLALDSFNPSTLTDCYSSLAVEKARRPEHYEPHQKLPTKDADSHTESKEVDAVRGQDSLVEPDGSARVVTHNADAFNGMNAAADKQCDESLVILSLLNQNKDANINLDILPTTPISSKSLSTDTIQYITASDSPTDIVSENFDQEPTCKDCLPNEYENNGVDLPSSDTPLTAATVSKGPEDPEASNLSPKVLSTVTETSTSGISVDKTKVKPPKLALLRKLSRKFRKSRNTPPISKQNIKFKKQSPYNETLFNAFFTTNYEIKWETEEVMTVYPSMKEMEMGIEGYVTNVLQDKLNLHLEWGLVKVVPPKEWKARSKDYPKNKSININCPTEEFLGRNSDKSYTMFYADHKATSIEDFRIYSNDIMPAPPPDMDIQRAFWDPKRLSSKGMVYATDVNNSTSLFDVNCKYWNLGKMTSMLDVLEDVYETSVLGMNNSYVYYGGRFTCFSCHIENGDSYSINYHHWGDPKEWYTNRVSEYDEWHRVLADEYKVEYKECGGHFRHKNMFPTPELFTSQKLKVGRVVQNPGEFIIAFARGWHFGFNHGFNCNEAVNFATPSWLPLLETAVYCKENCTYRDLAIPYEKFMRCYEIRKENENKKTKGRKAPTKRSLSDDELDGDYVPGNKQRFKKLKTGSGSLTGIYPDVPDVKSRRKTPRSKPETIKVKGVVTPNLKKKIDHSFSSKPSTTLITKSTIKPPKSLIKPPPTQGFGLVSNKAKQLSFAETLIAQQKEQERTKLQETQEQQRKLKERKAKNLKIHIPVITSSSDIITPILNKMKK